MRRYGPIWVGMVSNTVNKINSAAVWVGQLGIR